MGKVLLHIGYHKTGSTLLQSAFFSDPAGGFLMPEAPRHRLLKDFVVPPPYRFDRTATRRAYEPLLDRAAALGKIAVLSHERFSGYPPTGGFDAPIIARRLHRTFSDALVLIVIREQLSHVLSMYSQYVTDGGELSLNDYLGDPDPHLRRVPGFSVEFYRYDGLINDYQHLFGQERVLVLPYELLRADSPEFVRRVCAFVGIPEQPISAGRANPRRPALMQAVMRRANAIFSDNQLSRRPLWKIDRISKGFARTRPLFERLSPAILERHLLDRQKRCISDRLSGRFAASNVTTMRLTGLDLAAYGYECPDQG